MPNVLARKLKKFKETNVSVSLRMHREDVVALDEIETATGLKWDWLLRAIAHQLAKNWDREKKITLPAVVVILNEKEARRLGLINADHSGQTHRDLVRGTPSVA